MNPRLFLPIEKGSEQAKNVAEKLRVHRDTRKWVNKSSTLPIGYNNNTDQNLYKSLYGSLW